MSRRKKSSRVWITLLLLAVFGTGGYFWARSAGLTGAGEDSAVRGEAVRRGPLSITVTESGNLESTNSTSLTNELEGRTTILYLVEEGAQVEPGQLLCELDTSNLIDRRVQQEIRVQNAEAAHIKAEQTFEIQKSQNQSEIALAERELEFAKEDLTKYDDGDWPQEQQKAEEDILIANEELTRANQELEWSKKLAEKGFLEQSQLDADRLSATRAKITVDQRQRELELLTRYTYPRRKKELDADLVEKGRELERARLEAAARIVDFEADLRSTKATLELEQSELEDLVEQISKARIVAPVGGMVVYYKERSRWGNSEPIREGTEVRERQELIQIPSSDRMTAQVSLHESVLERVKPGLPCRITVDAIPGEVLAGVVRFKSVLPDQMSFWANPDLRVYRTDIEVTDRHPAIRPGMSCSVEILIEDFDDVLYIPVQSVFLDAGEPVAFVASKGGYEMRKLTVGLNDGKVVIIEAGLDEGEVVALSKPKGMTLRPAKTEDAGDQEWKRPEGMSPGKESSLGGGPSSQQGMEAGKGRQANMGQGKRGQAKMGQGSMGSGSPGSKGATGRSGGAPAGRGHRPGGSE